jgi:predicted GH43/DUF377 family glycosyl hydrolase
MRWVKKGLIFTVQGQYEWMAHHAAAPVADKVNDEVLRIYFAPRDKQGRSHAAFIEVELDNPQNVLYVHDQPVLSPGKLGAFDDSGVVTSCIVNREGKKYLYYAGYNQTVTVPYRNALGVASSDDGGLTFHRISDGPVVDRSPCDPYFIATAFTMFDEDRWKLWYASSTGWSIISGRPEPQYQIKYAESQDGINWTREGVVCIEYKSEGEANVRPYVLKENGLYRMWYCYRGSINYRTDKSQSYRIGYAESDNGLRWSRRDEEVGIDRSEEGWDSQMIEYPCLYEHKGRKFMLYNGNGFGETGFGYAILDE